MNWIVQHILSLVIFSPLLGAVVLVAVPKGKVILHKILALLVTLTTFVLSLCLVLHFKDQAGYQFTEQFHWIPALGIQYHLGVDGFSLWLVVLTTFLMPLAVLFSTTSITEKQKSYYLYLLVLETGMLGAFLALDVFLFYLFWEGMLIPMYFLIGIYGAGRKVYAALKFFLFTLVGSVLMLMGILYLYYQSGQSFSLNTWLDLDLPVRIQLILFTAFSLSFAIKVPIVPLHTWLPDAHTEAPTAGSVILAGVLLKMGTYGFVRFAMPLFPEGLILARPYIVVLAVIGILYGALVAMVQKDMKRLVAYSSVAHLGFVMLGLMALNAQAITGAVYQMLNHGISSGGLFFLVGMVYDRTHTRLIADYGGIGKLMPLYATIFLVVALSSIALPGTNGFVGEFLILSGSFRTLPWPTALATLGVIFSAVYMLWLVERIFFGPVTKPGLKNLTDMNLREALVMIPLVVMIFWMGLKPNFFLQKIDLATTTLMERMAPPSSDWALNKEDMP
jgi:NADH-quinone oxidoreductase subunit M